MLVSKVYLRLRLFDPTEVVNTVTEVFFVKFPYSSQTLGGALAFLCWGGVLPCEVDEVFVFVSSFVRCPLF